MYFLDVVYLLLCYDRGPCVQQPIKLMYNSLLCKELNTVNGGEQFLDFLSCMSERHQLHKHKIRLSKHLQDSDYRK